MATITIEGQLADDLTLRFSEGANAYAYGRVIENFSKKQLDGTRQKLRAIGYDLAIFGTQAENATESLKKGTRVVVTGTFEPNDYTKDGAKHEGTRVVVTSITPSLRFATAAITRNPKANEDAEPESDDAGVDPWAETSPAK